MKRALVTGATGFVGRQTLAPLAARGFEVVGVTSHDRPLLIPDVQWRHVNLLDTAAARRLVEDVRPSHVLHLAWYAVPGRFWTAAENIDWLAASAALLLAFEDVKGRRFVGAGTCAEYDWADGRCVEQQTRLGPATLYGRAKDAVRALMESVAARAAFSAAWGRVFHLYGPYEHPARFVPSVARSLLAGMPARCTIGTQLRDFLHVEDVGSAFAALLDSDVAGACNIASGHDVTIASVAHIIADLIGRPDLLQLGAVPSPPGDPPCLTASVGRLQNELRWQPRFTLRAGLEQTIDFWRQAGGPSA